MIYLKLLLGFLKVGLFTFGGAYGAIPLIREVVQSNGWLNDEALSYIIAVSESTPGPIMVNIATYVGNSQAGFFGAIVATASVVTPSFLIILLISICLRAVVNNKYFKAVLKGLKPCVAGIILATGLFMTVSSVVDIKAVSIDLRALIIAVVLAVIMIVFKLIKGKKLSPILLISISAIFGIIVYGI